MTRARTYRYTKALWDLRCAVTSGEVGWGTAHKMGEINRGTKKAIVGLARDEASLMRRWLLHTWPLDVWLVTALPTGNHLGVYELYAELHSIEESPEARQEALAKLKEQRPVPRSW